MMIFEIIKDIGIILIILFIIGILFGIALREDLEYIEKKDPKYRKYLKDKFNI